MQCIEILIVPKSNIVDSRQQIDTWNKIDTNCTALNEFYYEIYQTFQCKEILIVCESNTVDFINWTMDDSEDISAFNW